MNWVRAWLGCEERERGAVDAFEFSADDSVARGESMERAEAKLATFGPRLRLTLDLEDERVSVRYTAPGGARGGAALALGGWTLVSERGAGQKFAFPKEARVPAGGEVVVWSGRDADARAAAGGAGHYVFARRNIWNNAGDVADLVDADGGRVVTVAAGPEHDAEGVAWGSVALRGSSPRVTLRLDLRRERVDVVFEAPSDSVNLDLGGWAIVSNRGAQRFVFPRGTVIPPGATATVWSGRFADESKKKNEARADRVDGSVDLVFTHRYVWNDAGDSATLIDAYKSSVVTVHAGTEFHAPSLVADSQPVNVVSPPHHAGPGRARTPTRAREPGAVDLGPFVRVDTLRNDDNACTIA
jgi:Lamin Tail Domain